MRHVCLASAAVLLAVAFATAAMAQQPKPAPAPAPAAPAPAAPAPAQPPVAEVAPPGPYQAIAITLAKPLGDASFDTFRQELEAIAKKKDRAALTGKIVAKGFFVQREDTNVADATKPGIDNLAEVFGLDATDGSGWESLSAFVSEPSAVAAPEMKGVVCSPAAPTYNEAEFEKVTLQTKTDLTDWAYPSAPGLEVRAKPAASAPVIDKLGLSLLRLYFVDEQPGQPVSADWVRVVTPAGKTGYVASAAVLPLFSDQICYLKEAGGWRIAGYVSLAAGDQ